MVLLVSTLAGVLLLSRFPAAPSKEQPAAFPNAGRPKLVLIVVIDQFRYDYLERFRPYFVARGFNLLLGGASFVDCRYDYATTATCPGHATLLTGAYPNVHGIIANQWYDNRLGRQVYCAEDPDTKLVGGTVGPGFSPRNLLGSTLGDELRLATGFRSKVVAISLKDRASIIPGGHTANAAYWYDVGTGHFVTSTYYMAALPSWAAAFNEQVPARTYCGKVWQALPETPEAGGAVLKRFSPTTQETCPGKQFLTWLDATPFMTQMELNFALEAIKRERLGQGAATDLLTVSLSENDYIGHAFGPYSPQVADMTLQTDRYLADFFKALDRLVGLEHVWIALSSDHGAAPGPAFTVAHRLGGPNAEPPAIRQAVEQAL
jgi:predicted AlkP superfamily pyrophosphatase or phosphodiesterase